MIFKQTWLSITDNTNVRWLQVFQLYKGFNRRVTTIGFFIKGSARVVEPPRLEYKGFKFKFNRKGDICRGFISRTRYSTLSVDGCSTLFRTNDIILLKKKQEPKSKFVHGPVSYNIRRKKFLLLFPAII
jgi:ribosomal protein L14